MFKVGDKVTDVIRFKKGKVVEIRLRSIYPIVVITNTEQDFYYYADGTYSIDDIAPSLFHLENFIPPLAPEPKRLPDWPVDTKLIVSNFSDFSISKYRYFKKFDKSNQAVCFTSGATSWSGTATVKWPYYKLAEDKDEENER